MLITTALLLLQATAGLHGTVRSHPSGEPIPYAVVEVEGAGRRATADPHGYYALTRLPAGTYRVRVTAIGHDAWTGEVALAEGTRRVDVRLPARAVALGAIDAVASRAARADQPGPQPYLLDAATVRETPALAEPDVFRAVQALPSVSASSDFSSALYVRGGSPDQTLVTLDGMPLFNPFHLAGLFSAFEPDAVASVDVRPGALPAEMGDRLSGAVSVFTREGGRDRVRTSGALGLVSSRAAVDGPLPFGGGTFLGSVRRTYLDVATDLAKRLDQIDESLPYSFTDAHLKLTFSAGQSGRLTFSGYFNDEGFDIPRDWDVGVGVWKWGSRAASARYRWTPGASLLLEAGAAYSRFDGRLDDPGDADGDRPPGTLADTEMRQATADVRLTGYRGAHRMTAGAQWDAYRLAHDVASDGPEGLENFLPPMRRTDEPTTLALFAADEWAVSDALRLGSGVRMLHVSGGATVWMPRLGVRWAISDALAFTAGGGRYAQVLHSLRDEESLFASFFAYDLLVASPTARPQTASDVAAGVEWRSGGTSVRVDGYLKRMEGLELPPLAPDPTEAPALVGEGLVAAEGTARGLEVFARHEGGGRTLTASYALSFFERESEGLTFAPRYERRHSLDLGVAQRWGRRGQVTARVAWLTGQPYTQVASLYQPHEHDPLTGVLVPGPHVVLYDDHNGGRLPAYLRVDIGLRRSYERRLFGQPGTLTPYLQVLNVLRSKNVLWADPRPNGQTAELEYGPQLPILPTFGLEWRF